MKKTLLASALLASFAAYAAIPDDINARADLVEQRNATINANVAKAYQTFFGSHPFVDKVDVVVRDYSRTDTGATEKVAITIDWNDKAFGGEEFPLKEILFNNTLDYSDAVAKDGKLAVINGELDADALAKAFDIGKDSEDFAVISEIVKHLEITASLLDDGKFQQIIRVKPVDAAPEDGVKVTYEGFDYTLDTTDEDLVLMAGAAQFKSGKLEINDSSEGASPAKVVVHPFDGKSELTNKGDMDISIGAMQADIDASTVKVAGMDGKGKNLVFDPILGTFLGEATYTIHDISYADVSLPEAVYIKAINFKSENKKSDDLYQQKGHVEIIPVSESFAPLTGGMSDAIGVQSLLADFEISNMSSALVTALSELPVAMQEASEDSEEALAKQMDTILAEAGTHGAAFKTSLQLDTKPGTAKADAYVEFLKGSKLTYQEVSTAFDAETPDQFLELMKKNVRLEVNVHLPKDLVDVVGMGVLLEDNPFLKLDGKTYTLNLKNDDKGLTLNGEAFPM